MALSEHEQRMLEEMERNLYRHDAEFVASVSGVSRRPSYRSIVLGSLVGVVGFGLVLTALVSHIVLLGVGGFIVVLVGAVIGMRPAPHATPVRSAAPRQQASAKRGFMDRMNDRWDRRTS